MPNSDTADFFVTPYIVKVQRFYSKYSPGWPVLLAMGLRLKVPWLVNPLLMTLGLAAIFRLGTALYDRRTAWLALVLAGLSQQAVFFPPTTSPNPLPCSVPPSRSSVLLPRHVARPLRCSLVGRIPGDALPYSPLHGHGPGGPAHRYVSLQFARLLCP